MTGSVCRNFDHIYEMQGNVVKRKTIPLVRFIFLLGGFGHHAGCSVEPFSRGTAPVHTGGRRPAVVLGGEGV